MLSRYVTLSLLPSCAGTICTPKKWCKIHGFVKWLGATSQLSVVWPCWSASIGLSHQLIVLWGWRTNGDTPRTTLPTAAYSYHAMQIHAMYLRGRRHSSHAAYWRPRLPWSVGASRDYSRPRCEWVFLGLSWSIHVYPDEKSGTFFNLRRISSNIDVLKWSEYRVFRYEKCVKCAESMRPATPSHLTVGLAAMNQEAVFSCFWDLWDLYAWFKLERLQVTMGRSPLSPARLESFAQALQAY